MTDKLPSGWKQVTIGEVAKYVQRGKSPKYIELSDLPVINQKCIRWNEIDPRYLKFVDPIQWADWGPERFLQKGDILWNSTGTGTIGRACVFEGLSGYERAVVDSHVTIVRTTDDCDPWYLYYFIRSPLVQEKIEDMQTGSTNQVELSRQRILSTLVPLAPVAEQRHLVTRLDGLLARNNRIRDELERVLRLVDRYREIFLVGACTGSRRGPVSEILSYHDDELPKSWTWVKLGEVIERPKYGTSKKCSYESVGTPVLRIPNIVNGRVNHDDMKFADLADSEKREVSVQVGDLLIIRSNGSVSLVGRSGLITEQEDRFCFAGYLIRLRPIEKTLDSEYLNYCINSRIVRQQVEGIARSTSGVHNINSEEIRNLKIPLPPLSEQGDIVNRINKTLEQLSFVEQESKKGLDRVPQFEAAILRKAFGGFIDSSKGDEDLLEELVQKLAKMEKHGEVVRKGSMPKQEKRDRQAVLSVLRQSDKAVSPEELFALCGRNASEIEDIEEFFDEIRTLVKSKQIKQVREDRGVVNLRIT